MLKIDDQKLDNYTRQMAQSNIEDLMDAVGCSSIMSLGEKLTNAVLIETIGAQEIISPLMIEALKKCEKFFERVCAYGIFAHDNIWYVLVIDPKREDDLVAISYSPMTCEFYQPGTLGVWGDMFIFSPDGVEESFGD